MELRRLESVDTRPEFSCGDEDLDEFFHKDSIEGGKELLCVTYVFVDENSEIIAYFSLSNDAIKKDDLTRSGFSRVIKYVSFAKRYSSMPAAKIGRFGIHKDKKRQGHGTFVLDYLKVWFTHSNKTGCRFLVVDAYNKDEVTSFYIKNGFKFLTTDDSSEEARIMYFDLITFAA